MTDRSGHMFPSAERVKQAVEVLERPLVPQTEREKELQQAGLVLRDVVAELNRACRDLKLARWDISPDSIREVMALEKQFTALKAPWLDRPRGASL